MASPSESSNVIIVFKGSSNPAVSDQSVQCQINWTVKQLKQHLCQVYPGNPMLEEQRLIYSGQLLHDHLMLKDILRQYNEQTIHTIHIVCNREQSSSTQHNSPSRQTSTPRESTSLSTPSTSTLRHRNVQGPPPSPLMYSQAQAMMYQQAMQAVSWSTMNAEQLAWMQQAYTQFMGYYIQNYQMAASNLMATTMTAPLPQSPTPLPQNAAPPNPPPPPPPVNNDNNVQMNAQGGPVDEDEEDLGNRDWLDWFYVVTRAAVLFSIVYFYSSLSRFVLVTALAALFYIYQIGWFRAHVPRRVRQQAAPPPAAPVVQQPAPAAENEEEQRHMENMMDANMEGQERPLQEGESSQQEPPPQHTLVNLAWTFLISFFSSLIPEQPPPVNAN